MGNKLPTSLLMQATMSKLEGLDEYWASTGVVNVKKESDDAEGKDGESEDGEESEEGKKSEDDDEGEEEGEDEDGEEDEDEDEDEDGKGSENGKESKDGKASKAEKESKGKKKGRKIFGKVKFVSGSVRPPNFDNIPIVPLTEEFLGARHRGHMDRACA